MFIHGFIHRLQSSSYTFELGPADMAFQSAVHQSRTVSADGLGPQGIGFRV